MDKSNKMTYNNSYVNGHYGKINVNVLDDGVVLTQENNGKVSGGIALTPEDMEKLAKALFAVKKNNFPSSVSTPKPPVQKATPSTTTPGSSYMQEQKEKYENAYKPWTEYDDMRLKEYHSKGYCTSEIAKLLDRNEGAITSRLKKLGLT